MADSSAGHDSDFLHFVDIENEHLIQEAEALGSKAGHGIDISMDKLQQLRPGDVFDRANAESRGVKDVDLAMPEPLSPHFPPVSAIFGAHEAIDNGSHFPVNAQMGGASAIGAPPAAPSDMSLLASILAEQDGLSPEEASRLLSAAMSSVEGGSSHAGSQSTMNVPPATQAVPRPSQSEDGYVLVLLSTLRESAQALEECEADLTAARRQR